MKSGGLRALYILSICVLFTLLPSLALALIPLTAYIHLSILPTPRLLHCQQQGQKADAQEKTENMHVLPYFKTNIHVWRTPIIFHYL